MSVAATIEGSEIKSQKLYGCALEADVEAGLKANPAGNSRQ
jgi:hypothetical protein